MIDFNQRMPRDSAVHCSFTFNMEDFLRLDSKKNENSGSQENRNQYESEDNELDVESVGNISLDSISSIRELEVDKCHPMITYLDEMELDSSQESYTNISLDHNYYLAPEDSAKNSESVSRTVEKSNLKYDPYTIDQLHQDVLALILPKGWIFFQSDDDLSTVLTFSSNDGVVNKCIRFDGTCRPFVTINSMVKEHKAMNCLKDIEELLQLVNVMPPDQV